MQYTKILSKYFLRVIIPIEGRRRRKVCRCLVLFAAQFHFIYFGSHSYNFHCAHEKQCEEENVSASGLQIEVFCAFHTLFFSLFHQLHQPQTSDFLFFCSLSLCHCRWQRRCNSLFRFDFIIYNGG